jgi:hypothetical protein
LSDRLNAPDRARIANTAIRRGDITRLNSGTRVARIHSVGGARPMPWNGLRFYGPTTSRFDHHTMPRRAHPTRSIAYLTYGPTRFVAALAEYFQDANGGVGPIDRANRQPAITQFELAIDIQLLDLDSGWVTRAGGNQAITSGRRSRSREWARAIYSAHPTLEGIAYGSSVWGPGRCIALWDRGSLAFPAAPLTSRTLNDPVLDVALANAAIELGTYLL